MNTLVERTRKKYRDSRERANYSIFDIENLLKTLAEEGLIWCLQEMNDQTESETFLIRHYLNENREKQVYDYSTPNN